MIGADLRSANLLNAVLVGALLYGAVLNDAVLSGTDLSGAKMDDAKIDGQTQLDGACGTGVKLPSENLTLKPCPSPTGRTLVE